MLLAICFFLAIASAGFLVLRPLGLHRGMLAAGLAPSAGLALAVVLTSWSTLLGFPPVIGSLLLFGACMGGLGLLWLEWRTLPRTLLGSPEPRLTLALLLLAILVPTLVLGSSLAEIEVPLSSRDGAHHAETVQALRQGQSWHGWYPPGFHALMVSFLHVFPWIDTALGLFQASLGLVLLVPLATYGLGVAVWRKPVWAATGAVLLVLTFHHPYRSQFISLWPMAVGMILVLGLWATAIMYLRQPRRQWIILAALLAAAILLAHGTEVYTSLLGLIAIAIASRRQLVFARLARAVPVALVIAVALSAPYLSSLFGWAAEGGAQAASELTWSAQTMRLGLVGQLEEVLLLLALDTTSGFVMDAPVRLLLLAAGIWCAFRLRTGRLLVALCGIFFGFTLLFVLVEAPVVQWMYGLTYPWSHGYRVVMIVTPLTALLSGAGLGEIVARLPMLRGSGSPSRKLDLSGAGRRSSLVGIALALIALEGSAVLLSQRIAAQAAAAVTYAQDDAVAMAWLRQHAQPGEVVANDGSVDAGIWVPYKAGVEVLLPRQGTAHIPEARQLVMEHVTDLASAPEARAAACHLGVRYVYRGAKGLNEARYLPSVAELRTAPLLEEAFVSGDAAVFRLRLPCFE